MRLKDEFEIRECFEVEVGCPTLTVLLTCRQTMIPWNRFTSGEFEPEKIVFQFGAKLSVSVKGWDLDQIWRAAQMHKLRSLRTSIESDNGQCQITSLAVEVIEDEDDDIPF